MTPRCHRTMTFQDARTTGSSPCIGSKCALARAIARHPSGPVKPRTAGMASVWTDTGLMVCADNPNAAPWVDPAKEPE